MKAFYFTRYRTYRKSLKRPLKFFLISDLHYSNLVKNLTLRAIIDAVKKRQPDYICIAGDLIDCQEEVQIKAQRERLLAWLDQLGQIAPVLIVPGNHDFYRKSPHFKSGLSRKNHWLSDDNPEFFGSLRQIKNVHFLHNEVYEDNRIFVLGFAPSPAYYQLDRDEEHASSLLHPGTEDKSILLRDLQNLPAELRTNLPKHKIKLALIHSPLYLHDQEVTNLLQEFDYFISGHMHNGVVPPILNELWKSNRGIVGPGKTMLPDHVRLRVKDPADKSIVLGAITTIQKCAKPISFLDIAFPTNIAELIFDNNPAHTKTDVSFKYISYK
ncbi:MAG: metallophosphoesterase [Candidatus Nanosyncoccaceae bacterium]